MENILPFYQYSQDKKSQASIKFKNNQKFITKTLTLNIAENVLLNKFPHSDNEVRDEKRG